MAKAGLSALIAFQPGDSFWLSGFDENSSVSGRQFPTLNYMVYPRVILPLDGEPVMVGFTAGEETYRKLTWIEDFRAHVLTTERPELIKDALVDLKCDRGKIGIDVSNYPTITPPEFEALKNQLPECEFHDAGQLFRDLRAIKSENEIHCIRTAAAIQDRAYAKFLSRVATGDTETSIMSTMFQCQIECGATECGFCQIYSHPIYLWMRPTQPNRVYKKNDLLMIDTGSAYNGYRSDFNRYFAFGDSTPEQRSFLKATSKFYEEMVRFFEVGKSILKSSKQALRLLKKYGMKNYLAPHFFTGHSMGYDIFEEPVFGTWADPNLRLEPNMVVTLEYFVPSKWGPMLWEEDYVVREDSLEQISFFPNELHIVENK